jgi:hypothetical protein
MRIIGYIIGIWDIREYEKNKRCFENGGKLKKGEKEYHVRRKLIYQNAQHATSTSPPPVQYPNQQIQN